MSTCENAAGLEARATFCVRLVYRLVTLNPVSSCYPVKNKFSID